MRTTPSNSYFVLVDLASAKRLSQYIDAPQELSTPETSLPAFWPSFSTGEPLVVTEDLAIIQPESKSLISDISLDINSPQRIALVGQRSSGKSTLGTSFFNLYPPMTGTMYIGGRDISSIPANDLRSRLVRDLLVFIECPLLQA